jgi:hypothetical protein
MAHVLDGVASTSPRPAIDSDTIPFKDDYNARARVEFVVPYPGAWEYRVDFYGERHYPTDALDPLTGLWISIRIVSPRGDVIAPTCTPLISVPAELVSRVQALA